MMKWIAIAFGLIALSIPGAYHATERATAQGMVTCQTRPPGDSTNACASTAFVQNAVGGGGLTITNGATATSGFTNNYVLTSVSNLVSQVAATININGITCNLGGVCGIPNISSGANQSTTGTISATSHALTLTAAQDFANSQGIRVNHAGAAFTLAAPTGASATPEGTAGSTTYTYTIFSIDAHGGYGAPITAFTTTTGNATLTGVNFNLLTWTEATGTTPSGYGICKTIGATSTLIGIAPNTTDSFADFGYTAYPYIDWIPSTCPVAAAADALVTTVSAGGGTTNLILTAASTTTATSQGVYHDDSTAIQTAATAGPIQLPPGIFYISTGLNEPFNSFLSGQYTATKLQSIFLGETLITLTGDAEPTPFSGSRVSNLSMYILPTDVGVLDDAIYGHVDHILCRGAATGGFGNGACVNAQLVFYSQVENINSTQWVGTTGFGSGGMPPSVNVVYSATANNIGVTFNNIIISNDGAQPISTGALMTIDNCFNCNVIGAYINAQGFVAGGTQIFGNNGIEIQGGSQAVYLAGVQTLNFKDNIRLDTAHTASPVNINIVNSHFDFCSQYCLLLQAGQQIDLENSTFVGEGNSPWNLVNDGVVFASGFTSGPNVVIANVFNQFSGSGADAILVNSTPTNTSIAANQFASNTNNIVGSVGTGSAIGSTCSAAAPTSSFFTVNGVPGHC